jgi:protein gp37
MSKTNIEYVDETWHIVTGCKGPDEKGPCEYCYVKRFVEKMDPRFNNGSIFYPYKLTQPSRILVGNMGDLFGNWVDRKDILRVLGVINKLQQHTFLLLTKNPKRYHEFKYPVNCWIGTSVDDQRSTHRIDELATVKHARLKWVSVEPILSPIKHSFIGINWVVVGCETTRSYSIPRDSETARVFAEPLIEKLATRGIPVFVKDNLQYDSPLKQYPSIERKYVQEDIFTNKQNIQ